MKDRFVARRGTQGDNWHWERAVPPDKPLPVAQVNRTPAAAVRDSVERGMGPVISALAALGGAAQRSFTTFGRAIRDAVRPDPRPEAPARPSPQDSAAEPAEVIELPPATLAVEAEPPLAEPLAAAIEDAPEPVVTPPEATVETPAASVGLPPEPVAPLSRRPFAAFRMPAMAMPRMARPTLPRMTRPALPRVARPRLQRPGMRMKMPEISEDMRAPMTLFAALGLASVLAIAVTLAVTILDDNDSNGAIVASITATPEVTEPTDNPTPPAETPVISEPAATPTSAPTATPPVVVPPPPTPQGGVSVGLWSNVSNQWWFGDLSAQTGQYVEGEMMPVLATFSATPGQAYSVSIIYDCATDDAFGAFDYLSGIDAYGTAPYTAPGGPGKDRPDAAIPVPGVDGLPYDDAAFGIISLFGAHFGGLPAGPQPAGDCDRQRVQNLSVVADSTQVSLIVGGHLATAADWGIDEGAGSHDPPFGIEVAVSGIGSARANVTAGTVALQ